MRRSVMFVGWILAMIVISSSAYAHESKDTGFNHHARVGELSYFEGALDTGGQGPVEVQFHAVRLEDGASILAMTNRSVDGSYRFGAQFFDGAEHEVTIRAINPMDGSILAEQKTVVEVEGFHPPASVKLKTMAFLLAVIALGMTLGVGIARLGKGVRPSKGGNPRVASI
jgi:hypothetical protein